MRGLFAVVAVDVALALAIGTLVIGIWGASFLVYPVSSWSLP